MGLATSKKDEAEGEPHVARGGREHGREGRAKDAAEYVGSVGEFVLSASSLKNGEGKMCTKFDKEN